MPVTQHFPERWRLSLCLCFSPRTLSQEHGKLVGYKKHLISIKPRSKNHLLPNCMMICFHCIEWLVHIVWKYQTAEVEQLCQLYPHKNKTKLQNEPQETNDRSTQLCLQICLFQSLVLRKTIYQGETESVQCAVFSSGWVLGNTSSWAAVCPVSATLWFLCYVRFSF